MNVKKLFNGLFCICICLAIILALLFIGVNCKLAISRTDYLYGVGGSNSKYETFLKDAILVSNIFMWSSIVIQSIRSE